jgi:hypothetical protein
MQYKFGDRVFRIIFSPIVIGNVLISCRQLEAGIGLYLFALALTKYNDLLANFSKWPGLSKSTIYAAAPHLAAAVYLFYQHPSYWILAPAAIQFIVCELARRQLNAWEGPRG